jgi:hypothetical protein
VVVGTAKNRINLLYNVNSKSRRSSLDRRDSFLWDASIEQLLKGLLELTADAMGLSVQTGIEYSYFIKSRTIWRVCKMNVRFFSSNLLRPWLGPVLVSALSVQLNCVASAQETGYQNPSMAVDAKANLRNLPPAIYPYPESGVLIGQGWDSFNERGTASSCVDVDAVPLERTSYQTRVEQIQSTYSLIKKMTTSISASYNGAGAGGSASFTSSKQNQINSDDQNFLFSFESSNGSTFAVPQGSANKLRFNLDETTLKLVEATKSENAQSNLLDALLSRPASFDAGTIKLTKDAANLLSAGKANEFTRKCGDGFVLAIHRGARIYLVLSQKIRSQESKESMLASLSASGYGASGSASYSQSQDQLKTTNGLSYQLIQEGGIPFSPKALTTNAKGFFDVNDILPSGDQLQANPTAFRVVVVPYANLDENAETDVPTPTRLFKLSDYYVALRDLYNMVGAILKAERSGSNAGPNPLFDRDLLKVYGGVRAVEDLYDEIQSDLAFLEGAIEVCYAKNRCTVEESLKEVKRSLQIRLDMPSTNIIQLPDSMRNIIDNSLAKYKDTIDAKTGELNEEFFFRFFVYAVRAPLPREAYANIKDYDILKTMTFPSTWNNKQKTDGIISFRSALVRAALNFRLEPWKEFFCSEQKSESLCVSEEALWKIAEETSPNPKETDFTLVFPKKVDPPPRLFPERECDWRHCK